MASSSFSNPGTSNDATRTMSTGGGGSSTSGSLTEQVSSTAQDVTQQAKDQVSTLTGQAREQATSKISEQKERAAQSVSSIASAVTQVGDQLRYENPNVAHMADVAADRLRQFSDNLNTQDIGELVTTVERFARRQPMLFLGAAFAIGFAGSRFLKSSAPEGSGSGNTYGTAGSYDRYNTGGYAYGSSGGSFQGGTGYTRDYGVSGYGMPGTTTGTTYGTTGTTGMTGSTTTGAGRSDITDEHGTVTRSSYSPYGTSSSSTETDTTTTEI